VVLVSLIVVADVEMDTLRLVPVNVIVVNDFVVSVVIVVPVDTVLVSVVTVEVEVRVVGVVVLLETDVVVCVSEVELVAVRVVQNPQLLSHFPANLPPQSGQNRISQVCSGQFLPLHAASQKVSFSRLIITHSVTEDDALLLVPVTVRVSLDVPELVVADVVVPLVVVPLVVLSDVEVSVVVTDVVVFSAQKPHE
jgi:hypothetical protein